MTEHELDRTLDRTKGELVRALRRRAAELDAQEDALQQRAMRGRFADRPARTVREPNGRHAHQVAFFARHTFQFVATSPGAARGPIAPSAIATERVAAGR